MPGVSSTSTTWTSAKSRATDRACSPPPRNAAPHRGRVSVRECPCLSTLGGRGTSMRKPAMAARRGLWALARFLHRKRLPGEKEKNALAGCRLRPLVPKLHMPNALRSLDKAFFPFSPASGTHGAQKRAKTHSPALLRDHARVSFIVSGFAYKTSACGRAVSARGWPSLVAPRESGHEVARGQRGARRPRPQNEPLQDEPLRKSTLPTGKREGRCRGPAGRERGGNSHHPVYLAWGEGQLSNY